MVGHLITHSAQALSYSVLRGRWLISAGREYAARRNASAVLKNSHRAQFYERVWRDAAKALGAEPRIVGREILEISQGSRRTRVFRNETAADDPVTLRLASDKSTVHAILSAHGLPVPDHVEFTLRSLAQAEQFLTRAGRACVVKPARSTGAGRGITTGIRTRSQLERAALHAAVYGNELLIEEEVAGTVYRLLFADGLLIDTVIRHPPTLVGDGRSSIRDLVAKENDRRLGEGERAQALLNIDLDMRNTLASDGLSLGSIPAHGIEIVVKTVTNENGLRDNEPANDVLSEPIVEAGRQAAGILGVRLAGVDIVTADPSRPLQASGGVILEINASPGYHYHYHRRGEGAAVAVPILAMLLGIESEATSPIPVTPARPRRRSAGARQRVVQRSESSGATSDR